MPRFNSGFNKRKQVVIENKEFIPNRDEFNSNKIDFDLSKRKEKEIIFFNESVKSSITNSNLKFTNFISDHKQQNKINIIQKFSDDLTLIKDRVTSLEYDSRMLSIFTLYLEGETREIIKENYLVKSDIRGPLETQDALRVYWFYDLEDENIKIICMDPQHLVLPSKHNGKTKEQMKIETFNETVNSKKHCISKYFQNKKSSNTIYIT
ncbi:hypothetical protein PYH69_09455 [Mammaliicoccus lentus]|uniref:Uncharacterized protein n=1 Tax=Mammaliicoccus lentus TaxID=42858 RepID=A0AAX3W1P0_MAMLE|nr:hypothetical protein [Mammaliicoccus lentus]WHI58981.1 hypothetical protein PYH69_09455 [Mammaliicoccus lentus]